MMEPVELGAEVSTCCHLGRLSDSGAVSLCRHLPGLYRSRRLNAQMELHFRLR